MAEQPMTQEERAEILAAYIAGDSPDDIAAEFGRPVAAVRRAIIIEERGTPPKRSGGAVTRRRQEPLVVDPAPPDASKTAPLPNGELGYYKDGSWWYYDADGARQRWPWETAMGLPTYPGERGQKQPFKPGGP